jgi:hypothetical protein
MVIAAYSVPSAATGPLANEATNAALETRVSELETEVAALKTGGGNPSPTPSIRADSGSIPTATLFGEAPEVPAGDDGEVTVVMTGGIVRSDIPIVVRNNTGQDIVITDVFATGRTDDGTLAASAEVSSIVPYRVPAGGIAVGSVYFGVDELPDGLTYEFEPQYESAKSDDGYFLDVPIVEAELTASGVIGRISNPTDQDVSGPFTVVGVCFDAGGDIAGYFGTYAAKDELRPGDESPFDATFYYPGAGFTTSLNANETCASFLIGARGYAEF